ncbi:MAG: Phenylacetic acid catabolic protein, partial [Bacteroidota bacterium]
PSLADLSPLVIAKREEIIAQSTLKLPVKTYAQRGGKQGQHTEQLGYILADMQWMQRAYPGMEW